MSFVTPNVEVTGARGYRRLTKARCFPHVRYTAMLGHDAQAEEL